MDRTQLLLENAKLIEQRKKARTLAFANSTPDALKRVEYQVRQPQSIIDLYNLETTDYTPPKPGCVSSRERWDSFDWLRHPKLTEIKRRVVDWFNRDMPAGGGMILAGSNGTGKTEIARAICDLFGPGSAFLNELDMVVKVRSSYSGEGSEFSVLNPYKTSKLLVLDDLGGDENCKLPWIQGIYTYLLNDRMRYGQPTIITTNLHLVAKVLTKAGTEIKAKPIEDRLGVRAFDRLKHQVRSTDGYISFFGIPSYRGKDWTDPVL